MQREPIHGYGGVFRRDHRIYSIPDGKGGRKALPINGGVPIRAVGFFVATLLVVVVLARLPVIGWLLAMLPGAVRFSLVYLALPGLVATALTQLEPDGRPALRFLATVVWHLLAPADRSAGRAIRGAGVTAIYEPVVVVAASPASCELAGGVICGPARIEFRDGVYLTTSRWGRHTARAVDDDGHATFARLVTLDVGEQLTVRAS